MKLAIVKQQYVPEFTWSSQQWTSPDVLLDNFVMRAQNFGLICETKADIWVVEDGDYISDTYRDLQKHAPDAIVALYRELQAVKWNEVPWDSYDVIITMDQIASDELIARYPRILWCYYEQEHTKASFVQSTQKPYGKYDLFLNHGLYSEADEVTHLPLSLNFPYLSSHKAFEEVVSTERQNRAYLDTHCIRRVKDVVGFCAKLERRLGIGIIHNEPWDYANSYLAVANRKPISTREYLTRVGGSKYFILNRSGPAIGQSASEAAALGAIVLADVKQKYAYHTCHPETWVLPRDWNSVAAALKRIRGKEQEIIEYQYSKVQDFFLESPLRQLHRALEIKRR